MELKLRTETPESSDSSGLFKRRAGPFVGHTKNPPISKKSAGFLVRPEGFEPPAFWSVARRSIQLS